MYLKIFFEDSLHIQEFETSNIKILFYTLHLMKVLSDLTQLKAKHKQEYISLD